MLTVNGPVTCGSELMLCCQLDESCLSQHVNERKVRTLEEEDDVASSLGGEASVDVDTVSADDDERDLEELASVENNDERDLGENTDDDDDDDDDSESDGTGHSEEIFGSDVLITDASNSREVGGFSMPDNDADISEDVDSSASLPCRVDVQSGGREISEDDVDLSTSIGQSDHSAVSRVDVGVNMKTPAEAQDGKKSNAVEEFPDTSIDLQHISGSKYVYHHHHHHHQYF